MITGNGSPSREQGGTRATPNHNTVIESLVSGSISSAITTVVYQPLDLLKTRIQLKDSSTKRVDGKDILVGRVTKSALNLTKSNGFLSLWKGTGASLIRSVPGVGLYYAQLNLLQRTYSSSNHCPNDATQAFYFGLIARSSISLMLLPVTVVKVRYESGRFSYPSLLIAIKSAYSNSNGWSGLVPTVLRDSLFSGTYYMCYTQLKASFGEELDSDRLRHHTRLFSYGIISGFIASILTNPIDVLKTTIQAAPSEMDGGNPKVTMRQVAYKVMDGRMGFLRLFDGLVPRSARRTLISASTWTFYELMSDLIHFQ